MATYYIDPSAAPGDGTLANPFNAWTSVTWAPGNIYLQKRGTVYSGVFQLSTGGTESQRITVGAYFLPDGSDDPTQPRPVIILPGTPTTPADGASIAVYNRERDFVTYRNLDIRNEAAPEASDVAIIWLGNHCVFDNNHVTSNCAGVYIYGKNHVSVSNCTLDVVNCSPAYANHGILVAGNTNIDDIKLLDNTVHHRGGGSSSSHGIRCETYSSMAYLTNLLIRGNRISPPPGVSANPNRGAIGIYLVQGSVATVSRNIISGMLTGIFMNSGDLNYVGSNHCSNNMNFGIHIVGVAKSFVIESNTCNYNGGALTSTFYGRGIELSSAAGAGAMSGHTIRFNTCRFNYNYGGPLDNGSEGVGIGLDDGTTHCAVYGNLISNNEGNGIQLYGGGNPNKFPDTGGHTILSNLLDSNCTHAVLNRRGGGTAPSPFYAHIQLSFIYGSPTVIANNVFMGSTRSGIAQDANSSNIVRFNNIYLGVAPPVRPEAEQKGEPLASGVDALQ